MNTFQPCVILTGTVQVQDDMHQTVRRDSKVRLADYKIALKHWLSNPDVSSIVFVENSGFPMSEFEAIAAQFEHKRVELLSFKCPAFAGSLGKGYGEMLCLEHCLENSKILKGSDRFIKVTGRYYVRNIGPLLRFTAESPEISAICNFIWGLRAADSRVFAGSTEFLRRYLCPLREELNDSQGSYFEHVLARSVHKLMGDGGLWSSTPQFMNLHGVSASLGSSWNGNIQTFGRRVKHRLTTWVFRA